MQTPTLCIYLTDIYWWKITVSTPSNSEKGPPQYNHWADSIVHWMSDSTDTDTDMGVCLYHYVYTFTVCRSSESVFGFRVPAGWIFVFSGRFSTQQWHLSCYKWSTCSLTVNICAPVQGRGVYVWLILLPPTPNEKPIPWAAMYMLV